MRSSRTSKALATTTSATRGGRANSQNDEDPAHIQDAGHRKKVQNRIAQRTYREKIKKRIEALENFRDASTTGVPRLLLSDMSSPESHTSHSLEKSLSQPIASSIASTPSSNHSHNSQDRSDLSERSASTSSSKRGKNHAVSLQPRLEKTPPMSPPSLDKALSFEPFNGDPDHIMWDLSQAINIGLDVEGFNGTIDAENQLTSESPSSDLIRISCGNEVTLNMSRLGCSQDNRTALHVAAENGKTSTVQLLLRLQPDILARDGNGRTALHLAVFNQHQDVIQELLKNPVCLEAQDRDGQTALHVAATIGLERAVASLLAAGADLECKDLSGQTAFHLAAAKGWDKIIQSLFDHGAEIDAKIEP